MTHIASDAYSRQSVRLVRSWRFLTGHNLSCNPVGNRFGLAEPDSARQPRKESRKTLYYESHYSLG
jgi:hypothetical protein